MLRTEQVSVTFNPPKGLMRLLVRGASRNPVRALSSVSIEIGRGEVVGLLGANGAGKTTLIKAITGLLLPQEGRILIDGEVVDPAEPATRAQFGLVLPDDRSFYWRLTGLENLLFYGAMHGLGRAAARARAETLLEERGLADRDRMVFAYSSGMRAQLAIARALMASPELIVLDEPTRSLDPIAAAEVGTSLRDLASGGGRAVLMASHRLNEVSQVCDRVIVLNAGRVSWTGPVASMQAGPSEVLDHIRAEQARTGR